MGEKKLWKKDQNVGYWLKKILINVNFKQVNTKIKFIFINVIDINLTLKVLEFWNSNMLKPCAGILLVSKENSVLLILAILGLCNNR